jgi:hypothetical protein
VAVARWRWVVNRRGSARRGWPTVAGGRVLGREGVQRSGGARDGTGVAGGGPVRAGTAEALGGSGAASVAPSSLSPRAEERGGMKGVER